MPTAPFCSDTRDICRPITFKHLESNHLQVSCHFTVIKLDQLLNQVPVPLALWTCIVDDQSWISCFHQQLSQLSSSNTINITEHRNISSKNSETSPSKDRTCGASRPNITIWTSIDAWYAWLPRTELKDFGAWHLLPMARNCPALVCRFLSPWVPAVGAAIPGTGSLQRAMSPIRPTGQPTASGHCSLSKLTVITIGHASIATRDDVSNKRRMSVVHM